MRKQPCVSGGNSETRTATTSTQHSSKSARALLAQASSAAALIRTFDTGATRDSDAGKLDYEGFLSPAVLERYAEYMSQHRRQKDGLLRDSDNWQRGIPAAQYVKSMWRHFMDIWKLHRGLPAKDRVTGADVTLEEALCAVLFNAMGYLHEVLIDVQFGEHKKKRSGCSAAR